MAQYGHGLGGYGGNDGGYGGQESVSPQLFNDNPSKLLISLLWARQIFFKFLTLARAN